MSEYNNEKRKRSVAVPDFRNETRREYEYSKRPYQKDYLKGTEWDRTEEEKKTTKRAEQQNRTGRSNITGQTGKEKSTQRAVHTKPAKSVRTSSGKSGQELIAKRRKKRKKIWNKVAFLAFCLTAIVLGNVLGRLHAQINATLNKKNASSLDLEEVVVDESNLSSDSNIINILIVGADKRESWSESGRSDCVMIGTIDKKHNRLKLVSLMRDMYIDIPNHGKDKFNAAYSYGGISLLYQTIAYNFDIQLDGYVLVDFAAFRNVIHELGGVDVELTEAEADYLVKAYKHGAVAKVVPGRQTLTGAQALAYTRIRQDAAADFGRTQRQRTVMQAILTKAKTKSLSKLTDLAGTIMPYITTDLSNNEIIGCMSDVIRMGTITLDQQRIPLDNSYTQERINNQAVLIPDMETNKAALQDFIFDYEGEEQ